MKRILAVAFGLALVAGAAGAAISNSAHDFSTQSWNPGGTICTPCHAPHNNQNTTGNLLWNHDLTSGTAYTFYDSATLNAAAATSLTSNSLLCMSCHDGTVNLDAFGGGADTTPITGPALLDTDLFDDHPVGIAFCDSTGAGNATVCDQGQDPEIKERNQVFAGTRLISDFLAGGVASNATVECSSCHDVHNGAEAALVNESLLYVTNSASAICLQCHEK